MCFKQLGRAAFNILFYGVTTASRHIADRSELAFGSEDREYSYLDFAVAAKVRFAGLHCSILTVGLMAGLGREFKLGAWPKEWGRCQQLLWARGNWMPP